MKKLLIASMTAALTAGVWADLTKTQLSFEDGFNKGDGFWTTETADENITVGTYGDDKAYTYGNPAANTRAKAFGSAQNQFLKLETEAGKALWRNLAAEAGGVATVDAANSYVLDTLVQFTATDEAPTAAAGDKFILWLKSDEVAGTTSLMVTSGAIKDDLGAISSTPVTLALDTPVAPGQWARVSVKTFKAATEGGNLGFVVYVDGAVASATAENYTSIVNEGGLSESDLTEQGAYYYTNKQLFFSMIDPEVSGSKNLSAVGFEGSGSIDDLQIVAAADAPSFTQYNPSEEPVVNPVAPGETVSAATAEDAIAALTKAGIRAPSTVTDADAYAAKFEATATANGDDTFSATWTVTAAAEASLKSDADAALAQTLEAVLDDKKTTVTIAAQPGFYYTVLSAATVDAAEYTPNGWALAGDTVELALPEKSGTQGFYKIGISAVEQK